MSPKRAEHRRTKLEEQPSASARLGQPSATPEDVRDVFARGAAAWPDFLNHRSAFILGCIRQFARDHDERMEIYVHVCERLAAEDCRRVRQYRGQGETGPCTFNTWLAAVVFNLSREWIRSTRGRRRLFRAIRDLGRTDRLIFKYYFWDGYSAAQIAGLLEGRDHSSHSPRQVIRRLAAMERRLSADHRWRLVTILLRSSIPISIDQPKSSVQDNLPYEPPDRRAGADETLQTTHAQEVLRELLHQLTAEERVALQLRFDRGMTARGVALARGIRNYKRVYEIQGRALAKLSVGLRKAGFHLADFDGAPRGNLDFLR